MITHSPWKIFGITFEMQLVFGGGQRVVLLWHSDNLLNHQEVHKALLVSYKCDLSYERDFQGRCNVFRFPLLTVFFILIQELSFHSLNQLCRGSYLVKILCQ